MFIHLFAELNEVFACDFCSSRFHSQNSRKEHILTHFERKTCSGCNKYILRIDDEWYEIHGKGLCSIKTEMDVKLESNWSIDIPNSDDIHQDIDPNFFFVENVQLTDEIDLNNQLKYESTFEHCEIEKLSNVSNKVIVQENIIKKKKKKKNVNANKIEEEQETNMFPMKRKYTSRSIKSKDLRPSGQLQCDICKSILKNFGSLSKHMRIKHQSKNEKTVENDSIPLKPIETKQKKSYTCDICSSTLANYVNLRIHMGKHIGVMQYTCYFCGKGFYNPSNMR